MSLGIVFKGPEGIVLAADSRVTLNAHNRQNNTQIPAYFDNATKLLKANGHDYVAAVTYGLGAIGGQEARTPHSFMPELESELGETRLSVQEFAQRLSDFFLRQWINLMPKDYSGPDILFLIGGYDEEQPYGRAFELSIPNGSKPFERHPSPEFGMVWGGQREYVDRLIRGFDDRMLFALQAAQGLDDAAVEELRKQLQSRLQLPIPFQFLALQDCVDLVIYLVRATIDIQAFVPGIRGVGGAIDVATITRTDGFRPVQQKTITGEGQHVYVLGGHDH